MLDGRHNRGRVLGLLTLVLAAVVWPSVASAASSFAPSLERQSAVVSLSAKGRGGLQVGLLTGGHNGDADAATISVYPLVHTRSGLAPVLDGDGEKGHALSSTAKFALDCRAKGLATFTVTVGEKSAKGAASCGGTPYLNLHCHGANCAGVYPLAITSTNGVRTVTIWSLLSVAVTPVSSPVNLALVFTTNPTSNNIAAHGARVLATLARFPAATFSVGVNYQGIGHVIASSSSSSALFSSALSNALTSPHHGLITASPPSVDFAGLAAHHLNGALSNQITTATMWVRDNITRKTPGHALVLSGSVSAGDATALAGAHEDDVILPESNFPVAPSNTLRWGSAFRISGAPHALIARTIDTPLQTLAQNGAIPSIRRAILTVGEINFLHFQAPDAVDPRVAILDAAIEDVSPSYVNTLLNGLASDPLVQPRSVGGLFSASEVGANGYGATETLHTPSRTSWSRQNITNVASLGQSLQSFGGSLFSFAPSAPLDVSLFNTAVAESSHRRQSQLNAVRAALTSQFSHFHIVDTTINLAGSGSSLPVTLTSSAGYSIKGWVSLQAVGVHFPSGDPLYVQLSTSTAEIRAPADITGSGNFTLVVQFLSFDRQLVIAKGAISVHSAANSFVGYLLTILALVVIALWWWRTSRRRSKGRHSR